MALKSALLVAVFVACGIAEDYRIGGIFYEDAEDLKEAFSLSARIFNFVPSIREVSKRGEIIEVRNHVCSLAEESVIGIIDGVGGKGSEIVQSLCDAMEIPHVLIRYDFTYSSNWSLLNMYPSPVAYNQVLENLILHKDWKNFTLMYVKGRSLFRLHNLLMMGNDTDKYAVAVRELSGLDYRDVLINAKMNGYVNFVVDCPSRHLEQLLRHAQQVGLLADEHSYIILSPDLFTLDMERYRYGGVNMTGFRLMDLKTSEQLWEFTELYRNETGNMALQPEQMKTELLLVHDAMQVFSSALEKLQNVEMASLSCENYDAWMYGSSLLNFMRTNKVEGLTRTLLFDGFGERTDVSFDILELTSSGNQTIGTWKSNNLEINRPFVSNSEVVEDTFLRNKSLKVLISMTEPYGYLKNSPNKLEGNDRYEGFTVDLIEKMSEILGFSYILEVDKTGKYDAATKKWDGMIGQLIDEQADLGICDFTITALRQSAIDFSTPFMTLGITILYKEPSKQPPEMFSFMAVFSKEVWYYMLLIQLMLGVIMIFVGRISHKEWQNPVPCIEQPEELSNQFSFANSVWLIIGSVLQQGSEIAPIALAPRMITSVWWFFTMVMVASYVGTLVAFLTVENNVFPFSNVEELSRHKSISYGAKDGGSTAEFFKSSTNEMFKKMYQKMKQNKWLVPDNEDGVAFAENSTYAFFMESTSIEYYTERHCDLLQIGGLLDSKSYGIGMKKNSTYKVHIDDALLKLKEQGEIQKLKDIWWREKRGGGKCGEKQAVEEKQLGMKNMLGAFVVLGVGCCFGILVSTIDMLWGVFKRSVKYSTTFKYELIEELKFVIKFSGDVKPVKRPQKTIEGSAEALAEAEGKDEVKSMKSLSGRSTSTHRTHHSHSSRHSSHGLSIAFARRRDYS